MSEFGDALGGIAGFIAGGVFLLLIGRALNPYVAVDLTFLGILFILGAVFLSVILIISIVTSLLNGL